GLANAGTRIKGRRPLVRRDSPAQVPLMVPVRDEDAEWRMRPHVEEDLAELPPGQLRLDQNQMELDDAEPEAVQLALFPEPPPWEAAPEEPRPTRSGRLSRKRSRLGITPGQRSLF
ncbi:MAG: hypothetical protein ACRD1T_16230, partial [Acidimicrobiia bacterium]